MNVLFLWRSCPGLTADFGAEFAESMIYVTNSTICFVPLSYIEHLWYLQNDNEYLLLKIFFFQSSWNKTHLDRNEQNNLGIECDINDYALGKESNFSTNSEHLWKGVLSSRMLSHLRKADGYG